MSSETTVESGQEVRQSDLEILKALYDRAGFKYSSFEATVVGITYQVIQIESSDQELSKELYGAMGYSAAHFFDENGVLKKIHTGGTLEE